MRVSPTVPDVRSALRTQCLTPRRASRPTGPGALRREARDPIAERIRRIRRLLQKERVVLEVVAQRRVAPGCDDATGQLFDLRPGIEPCRDKVEQLARTGVHGRTLRVG